MTLQVCAKCGWNEIVIKGNAEHSLHAERCKSELGLATQALMKTITSPGTMLGYGDHRVSFFPCGFHVTWTDNDPGPGWRITFNALEGHAKNDPTDRAFGWSHPIVSIHEVFDAEEVKILVDALAKAREKIYAHRAGLSPLEQAIGRACPTCGAHARQATDPPRCARCSKVVPP